MATHEPLNATPAHTLPPTLPGSQSPIKQEEEEEEGGGRLDLDPAVLQVIVVSAVVNAPPVLSAAARRPAGEIGG